MMLAMIFFMGLSSKWNINLTGGYALCVPTPVYCINMPKLNGYFIETP
jgi:hypothetical protein